MIWKKKDSCKTIEDVIKRNTGSITFSTTRHKIKDIDKVVRKINEAKEKNEKITVVGDYDVDGVCASAIMTQIMLYNGNKFAVRLPRRMTEGFGLSTKIVDEIEEGILITVDNGIAAIDAVKKAKDKGLYVVVTDHHLTNIDNEGNNIYPNADIIINPNAIPNSCDFTYFCGAGIALKIAMEIIKDEKILNICKAYASLATIADVVLLRDENHLIVKEGLDILNNHREELNAGLIEMLNIAGLTDNKLNETTIGYKLGPMINAPGRLWDKGAIESLKLLSSDNTLFAQAQALKINNANEDRKIKVENALKLVYKQLEGKEIPSILFIRQDNIEEGIVGIIAGKITEIYQKPCVLVTPIENGLLKGSARSCNGIHLKELLDKCQNILNNEAFVKYGGHADAAGLSLKEDVFDKVKEVLINITPNVEDPNKDILYYDLEIEAKDIPNIINLVDKFAPYGNGNDKIIFKIKNYGLGYNYYNEQYSLFNENKGIRFQNKYANALAFDKASKYFDLNQPKKIDIIGTLSLSYYKKYINNQIEVIDFDASANNTKSKEFLNNLILGI